MATGVRGTPSFAFLSCCSLQASVGRCCSPKVPSKLSGDPGWVLGGNSTIICLNHLPSHRDEPWITVISPSISSFVNLLPQLLAVDTAPSDSRSTGLLIYFSCLGVTGVKDKWHLITFASWDDRAACRGEKSKVPLCSRRKVISTAFNCAKENRCPLGPAKIRSKGLIPVSSKTWAFSPCNRL